MTLVRRPPDLSQSIKAQSRPSVISLGLFDLTGSFVG
jgi:hypothetical protein